MAMNARCAPGTMVICRRLDLIGQLGMIVLARRPTWDEVQDQAMGWQFEVLVGGTLINTDAFASLFDLVQAW